MLTPTLPSRGPQGQARSAPSSAAGALLDLVPAAPARRRDESADGFLGALQAALASRAPDPASPPPTPTREPAAPAARADAPARRASDSPPERSAPLDTSASSSPADDTEFTVLRESASPVFSLPDNGLPALGSPPVTTDTAPVAVSAPAPDQPVTAATPPEAAPAPATPPAPSEAPVSATSATEAPATTDAPETMPAVVTTEGPASALPASAPTVTTSAEPAPLTAPTPEAALATNPQFAFTDEGRVTLTASPRAPVMPTATSNAASPGVTPPQTTAAVTTPIPVPVEVAPPPAALAGLATPVPSAPNSPAAPIGSTIGSGLLAPAGGANQALLPPTMAVVAGSAAAAVRAAPLSTDVAATALPPTATGAVATPAGPTVDAATGTTRAPVAEQIHRAIEVHASVVRGEGRVEFHLRLDPPELGQVRVHLTLTDQTLTARLVVPDATARQLVEGQLEALRQRLLDMGLNLGRLDVTGDGSPRGEGGGYRPSLPYPFPEGTGPGEADGSPLTPAGGPVRSSATRIDVMV